MHTKSETKEIKIQTIGDAGNIKSSSEQKSSSSSSSNIICNTNRVPMTLRDHFWEDPFFRNSWDDFERLRREMIQHSKDMFQRFEQECREMESRMQQEMSSSSTIERRSSSTINDMSNTVSRLMNDSDTSFGNPLFFPRRWMLPNLFSEDFSHKLDLFKQNDDQVIRVKEGDDKFEVSLDTHQYRPDELKVNVNNNMLSIEGKHEEKSEDGNKFVSRQFSRKYTLPKECQPNKVTSNLSRDGILMITAPKYQALTDGNRMIPIQQKL